MVLTDGMVDAFLNAFGTHAISDRDDFENRVRAGLSAVLTGSRSAENGHATLDPRRLFDQIQNDRSAVWDASA